MRFFKKKDKQFNNHMDNYMHKYEELFVLGFFYVILGLTIYGIYLIVKWGIATF